MKSSTKTAVVSAAVIIIFVAYVASQRYGQPSSVSSSSSTSGQTDQTGQGQTPVTTPVTTPVSTPVSTPTQPAGAFKDGTYDGPVTDAYFGNVQVSAVISGGKLADVKFLMYPNHNGESSSINRRAMPKLTSEAVALQGAQVDIVSGATQTSQAFQQSLQSALDKAKA